MSHVRPVLVVVLVVAVCSHAPVAAAGGWVDGESPREEPAVGSAPGGNDASPADPPLAPPPADRPVPRQPIDGRAGTPTQPENVSTVVSQTVVYRRLPNAPGEIEMTMYYRAVANVSTVVVYDYARSRVVEAEGFVAQPNGRWTWDGTTGDAMVRLRVSVNRSGPTFEGLSWTDTGSWALANPQTAFAAYHSESDRWLYSWRHPSHFERESRVDGVGYASNSVVYLGPHETRRANLTNGTLRVVRPDAAAETDVDAAVAALSNASRQLRVGARDGPVTVFLAPDPLRDGGLTVQSPGNGTDLWVSAGAPVDAPRNVWIHEYVHTRQAFRLGPRMEWFREASASYYEGLLSVRQGIDGRPGYDRFQERLQTNRSEGVVLTNRQTWGNEYTPYDRGQRVLAALDARVRNETDGEHTLQTVFRRMNAHDGVVTYEDFGEIVSNVTGTNRTAWLDTHVAGADSVAPPRDPYTFTSLRPGTDADDDGVPDAAEADNGTHPFDPDTDGDGLLDGAELTAGTVPTEYDTDGDGLGDGRERELGMRPDAPNGLGATTLSGPVGDLYDDVRSFESIPRTALSRPGRSDHWL